MASTNQLLAAISNMQPDAQANLPVVPNNGNPAGAHNMPQQGQAPANPAHAHYPWLAPSQHMQNILARVQTQQSGMQAPVAPQPVAPPQPAAPVGMPVMPLNVTA